jgi:hypothetical protein
MSVTGLAGSLYLSLVSVSATLPRPGPQLRAVIIIVIYLVSLPITGLHAGAVFACGLAVLLAADVPPQPARRRARHPQP